MKRGKAGVINNILIFIVVISVLSILFFINLNQTSSEFYYSTDFSENITRDLILSNCLNLSLISTSNCLVENTKNFYIYNITDDYITLDFNELKTRGGDCRDWSFYYQDLAKDLGFKATTSKISITNSTSHRYTIINDETGYCIIDQLSFKCLNLGVSNVTK